MTWKRRRMPPAEFERRWKLKMPGSVRGRGNRAAVITPPVRRCSGRGEAASYEAAAATVRDQCLSLVLYPEISAPTVSSTEVQVMPAACIRGGQQRYHLAPNMYGGSRTLSLLLAFTAGGLMADIVVSPPGQPPAWEAAEQEGHS